ncbi:hypothetical protein C8R45DRAFT_304094 [Mycena sanguinolenta]|nr:hypothetical protein C8R45DRAFT_304094 [Mycena sanguinolenta]
MAALRAQVASQGTEINSLKDQFASMMSEFRAERTSLLDRVTAGESSNAELRDRVTELRRRVDDTEDRWVEADQRSENQILSSIALLEERIPTMRLVEKFEVVDRVLRAYNDYIFDTERDGGLLEEQKFILKEAELGYIAALLQFTPEHGEKEEDLTDTEWAFLAAKALLTPTEWQLCQRLQAERDPIREPRNLAQHPRPDQSTAKRWLSRLVPEWENEYLALIDSEPLRLMTTKDTSDTDRRLLVGDGEYEGPEALQKLLDDLYKDLKELRRESGPQSGGKRKHRDP